MQPILTLFCRAIEEGYRVIQGGIRRSQSQCYKDQGRSRKFGRGDEEKPGKIYSSIHIVSFSLIFPFEQTAHSEAHRKLTEERATLTRFDNELKDLEKTIKEKKQLISDAELGMKKMEHEQQGLAKEKTGAINFVANLEKQFEWIVEEKGWVFFLSSTLA